MKKTLIASWFTVLTLTGLAGPDQPSDAQALVMKNKEGVAMQGYDPVAFFIQNRPSKGRPEFHATHQGASYHFSSAEHQALFEREPEKYAPAYGGYCGYAASVGKVRPADPAIWSIVDGRLILQNTRSAAELWNKDVPGNKARADKYWPHLVAAKAGKKDPVDGLLSRSVLDLEKIP